MIEPLHASPVWSLCRCNAETRALLIGCEHRPGGLRGYRYSTQPTTSPYRPALPARRICAIQIRIRRASVIQASSYISRHVTSQSTGEEDDHAATQLILLLTLSVVLLTLPWVVDHPVTLLVPVALFVLPFTSGVLRSLAAEGYALLSAGLQWFWRNRKHDVPQFPQQQGPVPGVAQNGVPVQQTYQPQGHIGQPAYLNPRPSGVCYPGSSPRMSSYDNVSGRGPALGGMSPLPRGWQNPTTGGMVQPYAHAPELLTPDLDFDESEGEDPAFFSQNHAQYDSYTDGRRHSACSQQLNFRHSKVDQAECTVYNWDDAVECTTRRRHRSLSELLNNGQ